MKGLKTKIHLMGLKTPGRIAVKVIVTHPEFCKTNKIPPLPEFSGQAQRGIILYRLHGVKPDIRIMSKGQGDFSAFCLALVESSEIQRATSWHSTGLDTKGS